MKAIRFAVTTGVLLLAYSCAQRSPLDGKRCPCVQSEGYVCCVPTNTCQLAQEPCAADAAKGGGGVAAAAGGAGGSAYDGVAGYPIIDTDGGYIYSNDGAVAPPLPPKCKIWPTRRAIEEKFLIPGCGKPGYDGQDPKTIPACHNGSFVPAMDDAKFMAAELTMPSEATTKKRLTCKATDMWINPVDWTKSYVITKSDPSAGDEKDAVKCSDGRGGMARMPFISDPQYPPPPLTKDEFDCLRWYVFKLATDPGGI